MCGKKPAPPPKVIERDPVAEQAKAQADAQAKANQETAAKRRRRAQSGSGMAQQAIKAANLGGSAQPSMLSQAKPMN